jgi:20S proteasome subunit beta 2
MDGKMQYTKTGTTICGATFKDGVVLAADTRATAGTTVADKNCAKLHGMAPNIFCAGAGTAADCDHVTEMIKRQLELHRLNTGTESRVQVAASRLIEHVFRYGGHIGTYLICGGVDVRGPQLIEVTADGNSFAAPYLTLGSGSLAAMAILDSEWNEELTEDQAKNLCVKAIEAGVYHDLGSGSNVDVVILKKGKVQMFRNLKSDNSKMYSKPGGYKFNKDRVVVMDEYKQKFQVEEVPMDLS